MYILRNRQTREIVSKSQTLTGAALAAVSYLKKASAPYGNGTLIVCQDPTGGYVHWPTWVQAMAKVGWDIKSDVQVPLLEPQETDQNEKAQKAGLLRQLLNDSPKFLELVAPTHRPGRYGALCSDESPGRGPGWPTQGGKDRGCVRCHLLALRNSLDEDLEEWDFRFTVSYGDEHPPE
jgi:hypothetical protein